MYPAMGSLVDGQASNVLYILVLRRRHLLKHSQRAEYHLDTTEDRHDWPNSYQTLSQERACFWRRSPVALSGMWTAVLGSTQGRETRPEQSLREGLSRPVDVADSAQVFPGSLDSSSTCAITIYAAIFIYIYMSYVSYTFSRIIR